MRILPMVLTLMAISAGAPASDLLDAFRATTELDARARLAEGGDTFSVPDPKDGGRSFPAGRNRHRDDENGAVILHIEVDGEFRASKARPERCEGHPHSISATAK